MSMSRKHYQIIADAVADAGLMIQLDHDHEDTHKARQEAIEEVASYLASALKADNPRFDRDRFMTACKLKAGE